MVDTARLKVFFLELIKLGIKYPGVNGEFPCPVLLEDMVINGNNVVKRIVGDYSDESQEYRLNTAGLKLYWRLAKDSVPGKEYRRFECVMGGDQLDDFHTFTFAATNLINSEGYSRR